MMKRITSYLLLCVLCLAGLGSAFAAPPETDPPDWPDVPFARNIASGEIICLGMERAEAEAITGEPLEEGLFGKNKYVYEGITLAFRDDLVVYIAIPYEEPLWAANGVVTPFMPTDQAFEALGMSSEEVNPPYRLLYFEDGARAQFDRDMFLKGVSDYQWEITLFGDSQAVGMIEMGDRRYLTTMQ
ncbi:MAG: hypothetical protein FWG37_00565 [Clostridia bacterium]|nr:hypothetical protein [Clostridia bacterium]